MTDLGAGKAAGGLEQAVSEDPCTTNGPHASQWAVLAGMRFLLSLVVFFGHAGGFLGPTVFTAAWQDMGELAAVLAFFVISGFSIAHSIERRPRGYLVRRVWRIWPTYLFSFFCCTLPLVVMSPMLTGEHAANQVATPAMILGNLFMMQGLLVPVLEANAATWTLAIEEWCYLAAPFFKRCRTSMLLLCTGISLYCYLHARQWGWVRFAGQTYGIGHLCFAWAWLVGFIFYRYRRSAWAHAGLLLVPVWAITGANELGGSRAAFTILAGVLAVGYGDKLLRLPKVIIEWERQDGGRGRLCARDVEDLFTFLGNVSYPLYIVHYPLFLAGMAVTKNRTHSAYLAAIFVICTVVYFAIDKPNRHRGQATGVRRD